MDDRHVKTTPFVHPDAETNCFSCNGEHRRVVAGEDDSSCWRHCSFDYSNDVRDGETREEWPHREILKAGRRRGKLVAQGIVLHVDSNQIIESGRREAQNARHLLGVEQVRGLVPVDPHTTKVVTKEVVQGVPGKEAEAVWDPVRFLCVVEEIGLDALAQVADGFRPLLIGARPDAQRDSVKSV